MANLVSLCKRRGFVFPSSELYGGIGGFYDYGPLGVELKRNIEHTWWQAFVHERDDVIGIESSILMHPKVWEASGHLEHFSDPLVECKVCHERFRADQQDEITSHKHQGKFTESRLFHTMFKTFVGPVEDEASVAYLRPETAQGMFTNFATIVDIGRVKLPFGIAQIGKAFRNEITFRNFLFRVREFDIAELEYFVKPGEDEEAFESWLSFMERALSQRFGIARDHLQRYEHPKHTLAHYSKRTVDIHYRYPWGWDELWGIANRTDFDLRQHEKASAQKLVYRDQESGKTFHPYVIEPTGGIGRLFLAVLLESYTAVKGGRTTTTVSTKEEEVIMKIPKHLAPIQVAVLPLAKKTGLTTLATELTKKIRQHLVVQYDDIGSIGRRYRRQDEIGTPFCVTVDFDTLDDHQVTIRDRDTMKQDRLPEAAVVDYLTQQFHAPHLP